MTHRLARTVMAACAGNALEFYDFTVFGYFATQIGTAFFPSGHQERALLLTFGTYGVSFLARPLGAVMLGSYADRRGRRASLSLSILLMTAGTLMMACMPGYATIGFLAPLGILLARLIQGFSTGGEFGGATAFMIEHASGTREGRSRRGLFGSLQYVSQAVSAMLGSGVAWGVSSAMSPAALQDWGFRLPFFIGLLIAPVGIYVRRHVDETPDFAACVPHHAPVSALFRDHWSRVLLGACVIAGGTAGNYLVIYLPTYAQHHLHLAASGGFAATFLASSVPLLVSPVAAHCSDRVGRVPVMLFMAGLLLVAAYPAFMLIQAYPGAGMLAAMLMLLTFFRSAYAAPSAALLAEMFPVGIRVAGMSLSYTAGVVVFGGFAGLILEWLIQATGDPLVPAYYLMAATGITVSALTVIGRRVVMFA